jgi:hypothetical protein
MSLFNGLAVIVIVALLVSYAAWAFFGRSID